MRTILGALQYILTILLIVGMIKPSLLFGNLNIRIPRRLAVFIGWFALMSLVVFIAPQKELTSEEQERIALQERNDSIRKAENDRYIKCKVKAQMYLEKMLNDKDSYEDVSWSKLAKTETGYCITHTFRAKNGFGAKILSHKNFYFDKSLNITKVE